MYLFQRIEEVIVQHSDARRSIGEFLLQNRDHLQKYSMSKIAEQTFTSKSTLTRFAKLLGYSGWKEFMYAFSHETVMHKNNEYENVDPNFPFTAPDDTLQIIENMSHLQIQSIQDTISLISVEELNQVAALINRSETVGIFGTSPNRYCGELFKRKLLSIEKKSVVSQSGESGMVARSLASKDCAIIISYSGNNPDRDPTNVIKYLLRSKVPIIGITSGGNNYLREYSDFVLNISSQERLYSKISTFATEESILTILNILYAAVFAINYEDNKEKKITLSRDLEIQREATFQSLSE